MERFKNFIAEGRDAPLYHGTDFSSAINIIRRNMIEARTRHPSEYNTYRTVFDKVEDGVSLSRSFDSAMNWRLGVVFELSQSKLIQNKKVYPINVASGWWNKDGTKNSKHDDLFEERVVGDITPLDKYLVKIWIPGVEYTCSNLKGRPTALDMLLNHPLTYDHLTGLKTRIDTEAMNKYVHAQ